MINNERISTIIVKSIIIIIIMKTCSTGPSGKNEIDLKIACATLQAHVQRKQNENQTQGSNQRLTARLNPSNVPVSNTV